MRRATALARTLSALPEIDHPQALERPRYQDVVALALQQCAKGDAMPDWARALVVGYAIAKRPEFQARLCQLIFAPPKPLLRGKQKPPTR